LDDHPFILRLLKHAALTKTDLKSFAAVLGPDQLIRRGQDIVIDGVECRNLVFIKSGCAIRYRLLRNGKRQIVNLLLPGDVCGLIGSLFERAAFSVTATTDLVVNTCSLNSYTHLCYSRPHVALAFSWAAIHEAAINAEHIVNLGRRTPIERLAHLLLDVLNRLYDVNSATADSFILPVSQQILADVLGLSVPHLNKVMQQLRSSNLIAEESRQVRIIDMDALKAIAHYQRRQMAPVANLSIAAQS
jgi:CRP-like cAMP-binding protein